MEVKTIEIKENIITFFMETDQIPAGIPALFEDFGKRLNGFEGRHLYGISDSINGKLVYRACALESFEKEADKLTLPYHIIPKGIYLSTVLKNWREHILQMPQMFGELLKHPDCKQNSFCLEDYTSDIEMLLMVQHK